VPERRRREQVEIKRILRRPICTFVKKMGEKGD
jgi:hypothetical protein